MNTSELKISVVVPVYNCEKYIERAIESVIKQTYDNWELIIVNDGSKDSSLQIAQKFAGKDARIKVIDRENRGVSVARNIGIDEASGDLLMFLDADDFLADNAVLDRFVNVMKHEEADIVVGNYERLWNGRRFAAASHTSFSELNPDSEDFRFQGFFSVGTLSYVWRKLYRKQFLEKNEAVFENLPYAEDKLFNMKCYLNNPKYAFFEKMMTPFHLLIGRIPWNAGWQLHIDYRSS